MALGVFFELKVATTPSPRTRSPDMFTGCADVKFTCASVPPSVSERMLTAALAVTVTVQDIGAMKTSSFSPGTAPVDQLAAVAQLPDPAIHSTMLPPKFQLVLLPASVANAVETLTYTPPEASLSLTVTLRTRWFAVRESIHSSPETVLRSTWGAAPRDSMLHCANSNSSPAPKKN